MRSQGSEGARVFEQVVEAVVFFTGLGCAVLLLRDRLASAKR